MHDYPIFELVGGPVVIPLIEFFKKRRIFKSWDADIEDERDEGVELPLRQGSGDIFIDRSDRRFQIVFKQTLCFRLRNNRGVRLNRTAIMSPADRPVRVILTLIGCVAVVLCELKPITKFRAGSSA